MNLQFWLKNIQWFGVCGYYVRVSDTPKVSTTLFQTFCVCIYKIGIFRFLQMTACSLKGLRINSSKFINNIIKDSQEYLKCHSQVWKNIFSIRDYKSLSNHLLEQQSKFSADTVHTINCFLNHNPKPICFVAHNGDNFDYPILRREIAKVESSLSNELFCIDSLTAFRKLCYEEHKPGLINPEVSNVSSVPIEFTDEYDAVLNEIVVEEEKGLSQKLLNIKKLNETTPTKQIIQQPCSSYNLIKKVKVMPARQKLNFGSSFKLADVYKRLTKRLPVDQHHAEGDVLMLITCAATLGDRFVDWANVNTKKFCDIPEMVPGKKIGS